jgi:hypothetical protein
MTVPVSDLQAVAPSAVIELYELQLNVLQHGVADIYRFHAGTSLSNNGSLIWNGNTYQRFPVEADGFEYSGNGQLPRPRVRVSNILSTITALLLTLPKGLEGARFTRVRTLARYVDAANFPGAVNPYGTPDPTAEFPREIYYVDRKVAETRDVVEFELAAAFDIAGVRAPKRQCIGNICQWKYKSTECGWVPAQVLSGTYVSRALTGTYSMTGTTITVTSASHGLVAGDYAYFTFPIASGTFLWSGTTVTVTSTGHGLSNGNRVYIEFCRSSNDTYRPSSGYYTIGGATTNTFTVTASSSNSSTGKATVYGDANGGFYTVATATTNALTITSGETGSGATNGKAGIAMLKITATAHGLPAGQFLNFTFSTGGFASGQYRAGAVDTNTIWLKVTSSLTTTGNVSAATQYFDDTDAPVASLALDACGKRLSSCKARFGATEALPFGSFPGIGGYYS